MHELNNYLITCSVIRTEIAYRFPYAQPINNPSDDVCHTLWLIGQLPDMTDQRTIDRHMGWILAKAHSLGILDKEDKRNNEIRALVRIDLARAS